MFESATFKLTVWYLAIAMTISLIFSVALYNVTTHELGRGLQSENQRIIDRFPVFEDDPTLNHPGEYDTEERIFWRLVGFNVLVFLGAGAASYWLARRTLEPIQAAHEQQKHFTSVVSHELRTPLTAMRMESEVALMNDKAKPAELRDTLTSNLEEVGKMELLINNLLRLTRLEADELQQSFTRTNGVEIVRAAMQQIDSQADSRGITVSSQTGRHYIYGDKSSLTQLLVILLDNAIKYSPKGSAISVNAKPDKQNQQAIWEVKDEGSGISPKTLEHIFERFYRGRGPAHQASDGYGLGLSIAKTIADLHGGEIILTSREGHGTTATVKLPASEPTFNSGEAADLTDKS